VTHPDDIYAQLFHLSPFPAVVSRLDDSRVLAINARTATVIGMTPEEAVGVLASDYYVDPAQRQEVAERLGRDGLVDSIRLQIRRRSGEVLWVTASFRLINWGHDAAVFSVFHDVSAQMAAEATLRESEQRLAAQSDALTALTTRYTDPSERFAGRLRSILEIASQALRVGRLSMWQFDEPHSRIECLGLYRSSERAFDAGAALERHRAPAYFEALERERVIAASDARTDARTREFLEGYLIPNRVGAMLDVPLRHGNQTVGVLCAEHVDGGRAWTVDEQNFAIAVANLVVVALTEEDRRRALARLAESDARARLIVDSAHDAFIGIDSADTIVAWNAQAELTFGWSREEALGRTLAETIIPPSFREAHKIGMRRFHQTGEAPVVNQRLELSAIHRSGHEFPVELTISSPVPSGNGFFFGAFLRDISERRARDAELRQAKESAESATRAKSEFLANMSHELRTPLNGVLGYAQLLQRDRGITGAQREALEAIARCGSQLLDLINDVLDLSKIEAGRLDIEESTTDLAKLLTDLNYIVAESARQKDLSLTFFIDDAVPRFVLVDERHLRQVLVNLLGNAVKFTSAGGIRLQIARASDDRLAFEVVDTGVGIESESLSEIFDAFAQTKTGVAAGGSGLGLAICNRLIARMGGELRVESVVGEGSRFHFTLPLVVSDATPSARDREAIPSLDARLSPGESLSALVVDDSQANRHILASLLESAGVSVLTASGGLEAIEHARTYRPDVIFMDLKMNDLDGLEATRRLGRDPATAGIPVVAVTASALGEARQMARDAGCVDYLSKPIRAQLLFAILQAHLGVRLIGGSEYAATPDGQIEESSRQAEVALRLRNAIALGDIGDIQEIGAQLMRGSAAERAIGDRIHRLVTNFDFDGLGVLADSLGT
jgi:PAS domain S-box-containing protein